VQACSVLCALSAQESGSMLVAAGGGVERIRDVLQDSSLRTHSMVVQSSCLALDFLADVATIRRQIGESGCVEAILEALAGHKMNAGVAARACAALYNLGEADPANQERMARAGAAASLLAVMKQHKSDASVVQHAAAALAALAATHAPNRQAVSGAGGIGHLTAALRSPLLHDAPTSEAVCAALASLALEGSLQVQLVEAAEAVVAAIRNHLPAALGECEGNEGQEEGIGVCEAAVRMLEPLTRNAALKGRLLEAGACGREGAGREGGREVGYSHARLLGYLVVFHAGVLRPSCSPRHIDV